jgi:hypothetical protein
LDAGVRLRARAAARETEWARRDPRAALAKKAAATALREPKAKAAPAPAVLRLVGEAAVIAERNQILAAQPPGGLYLHPDALAGAESHGVIVTDGRGIVQGIEHRRQR